MIRALSFGLVKRRPSSRVVIEGQQPQPYGYAIVAGFPGNQVRVGADFNRLCRPDSPLVRLISRLAHGCLAVWQWPCDRVDTSVFWTCRGAQSPCREGHEAGLEARSAS